MQSRQNYQLISCFLWFGAFGDCSSKREDRSLPKHGSLFLEHRIYRFYLAPESSTISIWIWDLNGSEKLTVDRLQKLKFLILPILPIGYILYKEFFQVVIVDWPGLFLQIKGIEKHVFWKRVSRVVFKMDLFVGCNHIDQINHLNCVNEVGIVDFEADIISKSK